MPQLLQVRQQYLVKYTYIRWGGINLRWIVRRHCFTRLHLLKDKQGEKEDNKKYIFVFHDILFYCPVW